MSNDLVRPLTASNHPNLYMGIAFSIFGTHEARDFKIRYVALSW